MRGMPPATAASNSRSTPAALAVSHSSPPWLASSSLLALTTGLPLRKACSRRSRAGEIPPMTSTTTSIEGSVTMLTGSVVISGSTPGTSRSLVAERTATLASSSCTPVRSAIRLESVSKNRATEAPTLPQPSRPTRTVGRPSVPAPPAVPPIVSSLSASSGGTGPLVAPMTAQDSGGPPLLAYSGG